MNPKCIFKPQVAPASPPASYDPDRATTKTHGRPQTQRHFLPQTAISNHDTKLIRNRRNPMKTNKSLNL